MRRLFAKRRAVGAGLMLLAFVFMQTHSLSAFESVGRFVDHVYTDDEGGHKYVVFVPADYTPRKKWPVILFLHGAGERGNDGRKQLTIGLGPVVRANLKTFSNLVVFPQCENVKGRALNGWSADSPDGKRAVEILKAVEQKYSVDVRHRILTGWSMGGYGTWSIAAARPELFSSAVPIAGGGDVKSASKLKDLPIWAFHGADDAVVRKEESQKMIAALKSVGSRQVRYTEHAGSGHGVWKQVYADDALYRWMLDPGDHGSSVAAYRGSPGIRPPKGFDKEQPFVSALEIPNAVFVRMGNNMLKTLAYSIPKLVPKDALTGKIADISMSTVTSGRSFSVQFTNIDYQGRIVRAVLRTYKKGRLNIQLGVKDVHLRINRTYVTGRRRSAVAGPIDIVIGHRRPVWLSLAVEPYVENRKLRMRLKGTRFEIPNDNWHVSPPAGVQTQGLGMTGSRVSSSLVSGLYENKARIEQEVNAIVPALLARVEENLEMDEVTEMVEAVWPLPVYRPRVRVWAQDVSTDLNGVSIVMGLSVAAVDSRAAPKSPRIVASAGPPLDELPRDKGFLVGVSPKILEPLSDLLIRSQVARVHVQDIPEKKFGLLADRKALSAAIPDMKHLKPGTEIWSELVLVKPFQVFEESPNVSDVSTVEPKATEDTTKKTSTSDADSSITATKPSEGSANSEGGTQKEDSSKSDNSKSNNTKPDKRPALNLRFELPRSIISLAVRSDPANPQWNPYAEFEFKITQHVAAEVVRPSFRKRAMRLEWLGDPQVQMIGRFATGYHPQDPTLHVEKFRQLFLNGWKAWSQEGPLSDLIVSDIDFGDSLLRLNELRFSNGYLLARFSAPGVKITNSSVQNLVYETKSPQSRWGGPYTLEPGASHVYRVAHPLIYRRKIESTYQMNTLPSGSHSEFRIRTPGDKPALFQARDHIPGAKK